MCVSLCDVTDTAQPAGDEASPKKPDPAHLRGRLLFPRLAASHRAQHHRRLDPRQFRLRHVRGGAVLPGARRLPADRHDLLRRQPFAVRLVQHQLSQRLPGDPVPAEGLSPGVIVVERGPGVRAGTRELRQLHEDPEPAQQQPVTRPLLPPQRGPVTARSRRSSELARVPGMDKGTATALGDPEPAQHSQ